MKKLMTFVCAAFAVIIMAACSSNSPKGVTEKALKCITDKDYKGYAELVYFDEEKVAPEEQAEKRKQLVELLETKMPMVTKQQGELKSFKVTSEEVSDDGTTATVEYASTYEKEGEKKEMTEKVNLKKNKDGKWMLSM